MVFLPSFHKWENTTELFGMKMYYIKNQKKKNLEAILTLNEWQKEKKLKRMLIPVFFFFSPQMKKLRSAEVRQLS